jgi:dTDP-glucose 4,6-dehydratase
LELCKKILDILNKPQSLIEFVEDRKGHDFRYAIDYSKSKQELSWEPLADFEIELEKTVNILKTKFSKP